MFTFDYREDFRGTTLAKVISAALMGGAISVMHYTGMASVSFIPAAVFPKLAHTVSMSPIGNNGLFIVTLLVLGTAILTSSEDRQTQAEAVRLNERLEQRVAERTRQLTAANQELRREIAERQRAEDALRQSEDRLRLVLDTTPALIHSARPDGYLDYFNQRWLKYVELSLEDMQGWGWTKAIHPEDVERIVTKWRSSLATGEPFLHEARVPRADGEYRWMLHHNVPLRDEQGKIVKWYGLSIDIEDRKRTEEALKSSEREERELAKQLKIERARLVEAQEVGKIGSWEAELPSLNVIWSEQTHRIFETDPSRFHPTRPKFVEFVHTEDRAKVDAAFAGSLDKRSPCTVEYRIVMPDGRVKILEERWQTFHDEEGEPVRVAGTCRDITERKLLAEQARQAQKMEAIGQFAGGIAHDFNNLLLVILGQCEFVLKRIEPGDNRYGRLQEIRRAAERAQWLTAQLMIFARRGELELQAIDLNSALKELHELLERLIGEDIVLVTELSPTLGRIKSDRSLIQQVIMNLAANARDAMPGGGTLKIATENVEIRAASITEHRGVPAGRYVMLTVTDSGTGMDAETQARLFEPFFTTKEAGKGTGLGLAVVRSIVAQSGGHVTVQSEPGHGSTFKVLLPVVEHPEQTQLAKKTEEISPRGSETILLVEDAQSVRIVIRGYLESGGYFVLAPETLGQALELAQKHQGPIQLLLTDVVMPGMGGAELARQIKSVRPDIKVLYMSGYAPRAAGRDEGLEEGAPFLQKPFASEDLLRSVRRVLDPR